MNSHWNFDIAHLGNRPFRWRPLASVFVALLSLAIFGSGALTGRNSAAETLSVDGSEPISYRHVYVPADDTKAWPLAGQKFLPIDADELRRLILAANGGPGGRAPRAVIAEAIYTGRMEGLGILRGRGTWRIELQGGSSAILPLGNIPLTIREPHWRENSQRPARLGLWGRKNGQAEMPGLEVMGSGILEFSWQMTLDSLQTKAEGAWRLPPSAANRLILDLPPTHRPLVEGGVILEADQPTENATANTNFRRWEIVLGGSSDAKLRIISAGGEQAEKLPDVRLREEAAYQLDARGVNITATLFCEGAISQLRELIVPLPAGVQFTSTQADGQELAWQISTHGANASQEAVIELPNWVDRDGCTLTLCAWHPLPTSRPWRLPLLRPEGTLWISGTFELSLAPSLELQRLMPIDCIQAGVVQAADNRTGFETHWFTSYSPTAALELSVDRREPNVSALLGSTLSVRETYIEGQLTTQLDVTQGSIHELTGELAKGWIVESVESIPEDAIGEWMVNRNGGTTEIKIQLATSLTPGRAVTVRIAGRLEPTSYAEPIAAETLRMVRWNGIDVANHLLSFQAVEPYAAEPMGELPASQSEQFIDGANVLPDAVDATVFDLAQAPKSAALRIVLERGEFEADITCGATFAGDEARLTHQLFVKPLKSRVDRLLVFANSPLGADVRWTDRESSTTLSAERLPTTDPRRFGFPDDGDLWLVRLRQPATRQLEIVAAQTLKLSGRQQVPLLSLPRAVEQRGRIHVSSDVVRLPILEQTYLQPVPAPVAVDDEPLARRAPSVIGAYRYDPADCSDAARCPRLWTAERESSSTDRLIARHAQLKSYFSVDGRTAHQMIYQLEAADAIEVVLPTGTEKATASLDNRPLTLTQTNQPAEQNLFRVPKHEEGATLRLQFCTRQAPLATGAKLHPPIVDLSILSGEWTVWLPAEFDATSSNAWQADESLNWRQRLFGPLGQSTTSNPFDPLRAASGDGTPAPSLAVTAILPPASQAFGGSNAALDGWRTYKTTFVANAPLPFVVVNPPSMISLAVALFLLCFVAGRRIAEWHRTLFVAIAVAIAGFALVLPSPFAPLATGVFLGLMFSLITVRRPSIATEDSPTKTWNRFSATGATAIVIAVFVAKSSPAQPPASQQHRDSNITPQSTESDGLAEAEFVADSATIHRVLIPADARGRAVGSKHYVDETFLRRLYELANDDAAARDWLIFNVACEGELVEQAGPREIVAGQWKLILELEVLARDSIIKLPLQHADSTWPSAASLDGLPVAIQWQPDGRSCALTIAEPGRYTLAIPFTPKIQRVGEQLKIDLQVPAVPGGRLQLRQPSGITGLELTGVATMSQANESPKTLVGVLDGSGRIAARWLQQPEPVGESAGLRVTELQWLHAGHDRIELYVKFVVEGGVRRPESLTVTADGPWKLVESENVIADDALETSRGRIVRVALPPDDIDRQEVLLRWEFDDSQSLGLILLPRIELESLPVVQRWTAVSSNPALACEFVGADEAARGTVDQFQARWGDALDTESLDAVIANGSPGRATMVSVRPRPAQPTANEMLHVAAGNDGLRLQYTAEVDPGEVAQFQTNLFASDEVRIQNVTLMRAGRRVPARWSRTENGTVSIFFGEAIGEAYRLNVEGNVPTDGGGAYKVPRIATDNEATGQPVQCYREDDVLLEMRGFDPSDQLDSRATEPPAPEGGVRFVGAYELTSSTFALGRLVVTPNDIRATGTTLTSIERDSDAWWATFTCRLIVEQGELGILQLRAPATWSGPFELQCDAPAAVSQQELDVQRRSVVVRFTEPVMPGKVIEIRLRGRLAVETTSVVAVPEIALETAFRGPQYVVVPSSVDSQTIAWTERGVQSTQLPPELNAPDGEASSGKAFEVTSRPFHMLLQPKADDSPAATVRVADTLVSVAPIGGQLTVTQMVVVSRGLIECHIELPPHQQLVRVLSDGKPALTRQLDERRWAVPLGAANLPQFLEIVTRSSDASKQNDGRVELLRPILLHDGKPIPVEVSLWSIGFPSGPAQLRIIGADAVPAAEQATLRLDRLTSIAESATRYAIEWPLADGKNWYLPWARRLDTFRETALGTVRQVGNDTSTLQLNSAVEEQLADAAERISAWLDQCDQIWSIPAEEPRASTQSPPGELSSWDLARSSAAKWTYCVAEGDAARVVIEGLPSSQSQAQLGPLLAIFIFAASTIAVMRWPAGREFVCRWPHALAFLAGIAYWAFLWPSIVGLLIAAGSIWLALRPAWPGRSIRMEGSTVISRP
jgi:hypothetical protein